MIKNISKNIDEQRILSIKSILNELPSPHPKFDNDNFLDYFNAWYGGLESVRNYISELINFYNPTCENPLIINGHRLDHHLFGYISPFHIYRTSFSNKICESWQHLVSVAKYFKKKNIRFIYAALPCKLALYPELLSLPDHKKYTSIIPQWRYLILMLLLNNVEVIDIFPSLMKIKNEYPLPPKEGYTYNINGGFITQQKNIQISNCIFSYGHAISATGAKIISQIIGNYLKMTVTDWPEYINLYTNNDVLVNEDGIGWYGNQVKINQSIYSSCDKFSSIGIFGNCNLQKFINLQCDITSNISSMLQYPIDYCGRLLPFHQNWTDENDIMYGIFYKKKIVIYLGFPSACFVRANSPEQSWASNMLPKETFMKKRIKNDNAILDYIKRILRFNNVKKILY